MMKIKKASRQGKLKINYDEPEQQDRIIIYDTPDNTDWLKVELFSMMTAFMTAICCICCGCMGIAGFAIGYKIAGQKGKIMRESIV